MDKLTCDKLSCFSEHTQELIISKALGQYTTGGWEGTAKESLSRWQEAENNNTPDDLVIWEPFENDDGATVLGYVEDDIYSLCCLIEEVQTK